MHDQIVGVLACLALAGLVWAARHDHVRFRRQRGGLFEECGDLFDAYRVEQDGVDFPTLSGTYAGHRVLLEPIVDHVTFRKIPSLWLRVTLCAAVPHHGIFDLLARPRGGEFFSPFAELECELPTPKDWPYDAVIRVDDPALAPNTDQIAPHVGYFADGRMKELLVTPRGVRLVYQIAQAQRANYLVLRQLEFGELRVAPTLIARLLDAAVAVHRSLATPVPASTR